MPSDSLFDLTTDLRVLGGGRVWSLMISLFGDLAQDEGDVIEGPVLSAIMAALDVKPEAARVALHRLRKDGWIVSQKVGRISHCSLTAQGRAESVAASPRIYAAPDSKTEGWQLVLLETADATLETSGFVQILPRLFAGAASAEPPKGSVALPGTTAPDWLRDAVAPNGQLEAYTELHTALVNLSKALPQPIDLSALEIATLRCLVVHNWRRLILKHPAVPVALTHSDAPHRKCHLIVADLLARFPRPALRDITLPIAAR